MYRPVPRPCEGGSLRCWRWWREGPTPIWGNDLGPLGQATWFNPSLPSRTPALQMCNYCHRDPALWNKTYFLWGSPALCTLADFPTWESSKTPLELFPSVAVCFFCSRVWVSQVMMRGGFACEILHNYLPIVMLGWAVRSYGVFSLHNMGKSIRRKPEQWDDVGWSGTWLPVTQEAALAVSQRRPVAWEAWTSPRVTCAGWRGRAGQGPLGWVTRGWCLRARQGKNHNDNTSHRNRSHFFFFYCIGYTRVSHMLVQSVAGCKLVRLLRLLRQAWPFLPWTLFWSHSLPRGQRLWSKTLWMRTVSGYDTWMGWAQFPPQESVESTEMAVKRQVAPFVAPREGGVQNPRVGFVLESLASTETSRS